MLDTHPETIRPDLSVGFFVPTGPSLPPSDDIASRMARVMRRQAGQGRETTIDNFRAAPETRDLTNAQLAAHRERASDLADQTVIRQDDPTYAPPASAGEVHGIPELVEPFDGWSDERLIDFATATCAEIITDDAIVGALLVKDMRPATIHRIWPALSARLGAHVGAIARPRLVKIAMQARDTK